MPYVSRTTGWLRDAKAKTRMPCGSFPTSWLRDAEMKTRMQSVSRRACFSYQRHVRCRKRRIVRQEWNGVGAERDQRCCQHRTNQRKVIGSRHPLLSLRPENPPIDPRPTHKSRLDIDQRDLVRTRCSALKMSASSQRATLPELLDEVRVTLKADLRQERRAGSRSVTRPCLAERMVGYASLTHPTNHHRTRPTAWPACGRIACRRI